MRRILSIRTARMSGLTVVALLAVACSGMDAQTPIPIGPPDASGPTVRITRGATVVATFAVEIADDPAEQERGLMGRTGLADGAGMAFVWTDPIPARFWMKDTLIPLDIAFWDVEGRIVAVMRMEPCLAEPCGTYGPDSPVVGALEVTAGALEAEGVRVGDLVTLTP